MDKPTLTPPELRRKKAEVDGRLKALDEEQARRLDELSADDVKVDDPRWKAADEYRDKREPLAKLSTMYSTQIVAAEKWEIADSAIDAGAKDTSNERGMDTEMPHNDKKNTKNGRLGYSLLKAMRSNLADIANRPDWKLNGLELEVHDELNKKRIAQDRPSARGIMVPHDLPIDRRAAERFATRSNLSTQFQREDRAFDTTAGGGSIPTILDTTMIELLRARMVTVGMGAQSMTDMQGLFAIPRQSTASTFYMVTQGASVTASNATIDQVPFSPHTGGVQTQYTRQLLEQTNQDAEMFVREDQAAVVARGVETAGLNGQGSNGFPLGLLQNMQVAVFALGTNGAAPTWTQLVSMQAYLSYFNADVGSLGYVCDALTRATLQTTVKVAASTFPIYLWNTEAPAAPVAGFPCGVTNLLPQNIVKGSGTNLHAMLFGNWRDMIYAFWSGMDTIVDPYTQAANGGVVITTLQDFDVNIRHYQSFANCVDVISGITAPVI